MTFSRFTKHVHTYGPSLSAAVIGTGAIIWQTKASAQDVTSRLDIADLRTVRHDLRFDTIDSTLSEHGSALREHSSRFDKLESKIDDTKSTSLGLGYSLMQGISGKKDMMKESMVDIQTCVGSGGKDCDLVKGIAAAYQNEIQKKGK